MPQPSNHAQPCLLIVDMINEFTFEGAERLFPGIVETAQRIAELKRRLKAAGGPVVYVNDNFGKWRSDFRRLVTRCLEEECRGKQVTRLLHPEDDDYFVLKPKHSGFYATPLELLLNVLEARRVIITGVAGNNCVLYTAADAYMRNFDLAVPADCILSIDPESNRAALDQMSETLKADTSPSRRIIEGLNSNS
jgi:nicotinamidase-related amidase